MIYQMTTVKSVINKLIRDLGIGETELPFHDFYEWIGEALNEIGSYYQYLDKEELVPIENHQGLLPCDLYKVIRIREGVVLNNDCDYRDGFMADTLQGILADCGCDFNEMNSYNYYNLSLYGSTAVKPPEYGISAISKIMHTNSNLIGNIEENAFGSNDININLNKITTGFKQGFLAIQYKAVPLDEEGLPLIPDDPSFLKAITWYIYRHLTMRNSDLLKNPMMKDIRFCTEQWERYCTQARAAANMPDLQMMEELKNNYLRLIPAQNAENSNYAFVGRQELYNLEGRR